MATFYIDPSATVNGAGSFNDPLNAWPSITSNNTYLQKKGTTFSQTANIALSSLSNVTISTYGTGAAPIVDAHSAFTANFTFASCTGCTLSGFNCIGATNVNGVVQVTGTSDTITITGCTILGTETAILISGSGCTNITISSNALISPQMNNQTVELSTAGAGCVVTGNAITHLGTTMSGTSLFGVYVNGGSAATVSLNTISGFYNAIEIRNDSSTISSNTISNCFNAGVSLRDANSNIVDGNTITTVWNLLPYNGGAGAGAGGGLGAGVTLLDIGTTVGNNIVKNNRITSCYQGIVSQADFTGNNSFYNNLIINSIVNGINYQDKAGIGQVWNNTIIHHPSDPFLIAGHGLVVQQGGVSTSVVFRNNLVVLDVLSSNVQCINYGGTPGTNYLKVESDYNLFWVTNSAHVGSVSAVNYDSIAAFRTALSGVSQAVNKEANTLQADPTLNSSYMPTTAGIDNGFGLINVLDINAKYRKNPPTRGAVEYNPDLRRTVSTRRASARS